MPETTSGGTTTSESSTDERPNRSGSERTAGEQPPTCHTRRSFVGLLGAGALGLDRAGTVLRPSPGPTTITGCRRITTPGEYVLGADIVPSSVSTRGCIQIETEDVILDGAGHQLGGGDVADDHAGVAVRSRSLPGHEFPSVTIRNLTVTGWEDGIEVFRTDRVSVTNVTARRCATGVQISLSHESRVEGSTLTQSGDGIGVDGDENVDVALRTVITHNAITDNRGTGVRCSTDVQDTEVSHNVIRSNDPGVFTSPGSHGTTVCRNVLCNNASYGIKNDDRDSTASDLPNLEDVTLATENYWGATCGPSSHASAGSPLTDPVTGALADGAGDAVSEGLTPGVSNVHFDPFLTAPPPDAGPRP